MKQEAENGMKLLRVENLVKMYKKRTVVNKASLEIRQGEIVGLL
ncbi:MAG TPA: LPS export ABC transporter ATP-binding protein, partial [Spirochaetota bacterium]|nr:LPS export ABC transporter ATP-binding protein [Spirochaetota bacterium]